MLGKITERLEILRQIHENLRHLDRCYRLCALKTYEESATQAYVKLESKLIKYENKLEDSFITNVSKEARTLNFEIKNFLQVHREKQSVQIQEDTKKQESIKVAKISYKASNMANQLEAIKVVSSLIPRYDGNEKRLQEIIEALGVVESIVNQDNQATIIKLITSKLEGKARVAVGKNPPNLQAIIKGLQERCSVKKTPELLSAKLISIRQNGFIEDFGSIVEQLTQQLEEAYISEDMAEKTAKIRGKRRQLKQELMLSAMV